MGKQKMVLKLTMEDDKKRSKAMQTAVKFYGVVSAEIQGEAKDKLVVIGNGVDPVNLTTSLRKKMKVQVNVESVSGVEEKKEEKKVEVEPISYWSYDSYYNQQPYFLPPTYVQFEV